MQRFTVNWAQMKVGRLKWRTFDKILAVPRKQYEIDALLLLKANRTSCAFLSNIAIVDDLE